MDTDLKNQASQALLTRDYDQIQDLIKKLESQDDPEVQELVSELKKFTKEDLAPSEAEVKLAELYDFLQSEYEMSEEDADQITESIAHGATSRAFVMIVESLNPEARQKWDKLMDSAPNPMQIGVALDSVAQMLHGKTYDDLHEEVLLTLINEFKSAMSEAEDMADKIKSLTDEQQAHVQKMLDMGYGEMAHNLLDAFNDGSRES
ncbi:hypothetical protein H6763_01790 [Candidatus Nomurabacteria bacterium]|nr:hypothetical protein [Candidatus Nomurabacteria bacterium]MCB9803539.1 hypothetical protein [Candidatus Nomurabacteria bacterium]